jgi:hypothetical protein
MIKLLNLDEITLNWELIKYGACQVQKPNDIGKYSNYLLANLLSGKHQCWFIYDEKNKNVKVMAITYISSNEGNDNILTIEPLYGFSPISDDEWASSFSLGLDWVKKNGIKTIIGLPSNPRMVHLVEKIGMKKTGEIFKISL